MFQCVRKKALNDISFQAVERVQRVGISALIAVPMRDTKNKEVTTSFVCEIFRSN